MELVAYNEVKRKADGRAIMKNTMLDKKWGSNEVIPLTARQKLSRSTRGILLRVSDGSYQIVVEVLSGTTGKTVRRCYTDVSIA
jgi:predicted transcriptional regulator of viral defense system